MISLRKLPVGSFDADRHVHVNSVGLQDPVQTGGREPKVRLDQFYTHPDVAEQCYKYFCECYDPKQVQLVEPTAGDGSFFGIFPAGSLGFDLEPRYVGIEKADFLTIAVKSDKPIAVVGNPPYGKNASMAVRIFNHAAIWADVIAFVVPRSFRKASIENRLNRSFRLVREEALPRNAFLDRGKPFDAPSVFQIWKRQDGRRPLRTVETHHPDFEFTTPDRANIVIQRVGHRAGRVHRDFARSRNSHYFIRTVRPGAGAVLTSLDFGGVVRDVAGNPSLAKAEVVALYRAAIPARRERAGNRPRRASRRTRP